jgi:hypothetical protein
MQVFGKRTCIRFLETWAEFLIKLANLHSNMFFLTKFNWRFVLRNLIFKLGNWWAQRYVLVNITKKKICVGEYHQEMVDQILTGKIESIHFFLVVLAMTFWLANISYATTLFCQFTAARGIQISSIG